MSPSGPETFNDILDAVYRHAVKLIDTAGTPMRRLQVSVGPVSVELEWAATVPADATSEGAAGAVTAQLRVGERGSGTGLPSAAAPEDASGMLV